jgi:hypothetical protein
MQPMSSSDDSSSSGTWASTTDSWDSSSDSGSDSGSDSSEDAVDLAAVAAQVAALVAAGEGAEASGDENDTWQRRPNRPQTLAEVREMLPGRLFVHELRFTPEQFEYLCTKLGVPEFMPTDEMRAGSRTCVGGDGRDVWLGVHRTSSSHLLIPSPLTALPNTTQAAQDQATGGEAGLRAHRQPPRASDHYTVE